MSVLCDLSALSVVKKDLFIRLLTASHAPI